MTVYGLNREQLDELKAAYFWGDNYKGCFYPHFLTGELVPVLFPGDIPDSVIYEEYGGVAFVNDDFSCSMGV